jgi:hypothetical protein
MQIYWARCLSNCTAWRRAKAQPIVNSLAPLQMCHTDPNVLRNQGFFVASGSRLLILAMKQGCVAAGVAGDDGLTGDGFNRVKDITGGLKKWLGNARQRG